VEQVECVSVENGEEFRPWGVCLGREGDQNNWTVSKVQPDGRKVSMEQYYSIDCVY
jgi:hypothetical protein